jgi:hypothetical protein
MDSTRESHAALWGEDGNPLNVEGAIADALEWLDDLRKLRMIRRDVDAEAALRRSIGCLAAYGDAETQRKYKEARDV